MDGDTERERWELLEQIEDLTRTPIIILSFIWILIVVIELIQGVNRFFLGVSYVIWGIFILDFVLQFVIAPNKVNYLKRNWLTAISLVLPALRFLVVLRFLRLLRLAAAARTLSLAGVITSVNRGMRVTRAALGRRKVGFVFTLTTIVVFVGAAGMLAFENPRALRVAGITDAEGFTSYGDALWWTAMIMTTIGSQYWPVTIEGRILAFLLSAYAIGVFGYIAATIASFFIGLDVGKPGGQG